MSILINPDSSRFVMLNPCVTVTRNKCCYFPPDVDILFASHRNNLMKNMSTIANFKDLCRVVYG